MNNKNKSDKIEEKEPIEKDLKKEMIEIVFLVFLAICISFFIITFIGQRTVVRGSSMEPTLHDRDQLIVYKLGYFIEKPKKGDVVVVDVPIEKRINKSEKLYIKRVIATEGDKVAVKDKKVYLNGEELEESNIITDGYTYVDFDEQVVPEGHVFVLGDNRVNSRDSRELGFINYSEVKGKAVLRIWPFEDFGKVK